MKYFYDEIIHFSAETDDECREMAKRFERQQKAYFKEFNKIKNKLPKAVLEVDENTHDAMITNITPLYKAGKLDIAMTIELGWPPARENQKKGTLLHCDVKKFNIDIIGDNTDPFERNYLWYKYGELLMEDGFWTHNFIFSPMPSELYIKCRSLEWIEAERDKKSISCKI